MRGPTRPVPPPFEPVIRKARHCTRTTGSLFGECLRVWRGDMTQAEIAETLDVSREAVSCWERGTMHPSDADLVEGLAALLGVDVETVNETIAASKQARKEARKSMKALEIETRVGSYDASDGVDPDLQHVETVIVSSDSFSPARRAGFRESHAASEYYLAESLAAGEGDRRIADRLNEVVSETLTDAKRHLRNASRREARSRARIEAAPCPVCGGVPRKNHVTGCYMQPSPVFAAELAAIREKQKAAEREYSRIQKRQRDAQRRARKKEQA